MCLLFRRVSYRKIMIILTIQLMLLAGFFLWLSFGCNSFWSFSWCQWCDVFITKPEKLQICQVPSLKYYHFITIWKIRKSCFITFIQALFFNTRTLLHCLCDTSLLFSFCFVTGLGTSLVNKHAQSHCVVLCRCETWSLTLRRVHRLSMLKNRVMRKIGYLGLRGRKWQKSQKTARWRASCSVHTNIRKRWAGHVTHGGEKKCI